MHLNQKKRPSTSKVSTIFTPIFLALYSDVVKLQMEEKGRAVSQKVIHDFHSYICEVRWFYFTSSTHPGEEHRSHR